jgi:hypothetical protein
MKKPMDCLEECFAHNLRVLQRSVKVDLATECRKAAQRRFNGLDGLRVELKRIMPQKGVSGELQAVAWTQDLQVALNRMVVIFREWPESPERDGLALSVAKLHRLCWTLRQLRWEPIVKKD